MTPRNVPSAATRRDALILGAAGLAAAALRAADPVKPAGKPTAFPVACMTIVYSAFPLVRALSGIKEAGYKFVAWGTTHEEDGKRVPVLAPDAAPEAAKELAKRCRDTGLEPVMLFGPSPDAVPAFRTRLKQAGAAGVGHLLCMGSTKGNDLKAWAKNLKELGKLAADEGVTIGVKPHGGNTGRGSELLALIEDVGRERVAISYDAGNVMDYHKIDPLPDLKTCAGAVRSFCIKDHRTFPKDEDCGPGLGEIDHYRLLANVAAGGGAVPLCCENVSAPALPRAKTPEDVDALAKRAREFLELVIAGLQAAK